MSSIRLMEVCGTHTMSIAKNGIKSLLPEGVKLLSGPGCPVCVTPASVIDAILELAMKDNVIIATYGDMVRVPGSTPGDNLARRRAMGATVEVVYSPIDAIEIAKNNPDKEVVFLGVGFETTAPGTAACILTAEKEKTRNFSVLSMLKTCEPAIKALEGDIDGFLLPGHVATIIGVKGFSYLEKPGVISGFEAEDIIIALKELLKLENTVKNEYRRAVTEDGNVLAQKAIEKVFEPVTVEWRGLGFIEDSGLGIRKEYSQYDAEKKFNLKYTAKPTACRCGDVITGKIDPQECPLFGDRCVPEDPVGPCMVSSEGACAASYKYQWTK